MGQSDRQTRARGQGRTGRERRAWQSAGALAGMVSHVVLMKPRAELTADARRALIAAFETAARTIPAGRNVRIGRRVVHGAGYEQGQPDLADYIVIIDFDDIEGLRAYLAHPAHEPLGRLFNHSLGAAAVYDYEVFGLEKMAELT